MDRLATFRSFVAQAPDDPFPRYGLAMELRSRGEATAAVAEFVTLMQRFPDYVPTYLMAGQTLAELGRVDEAKDAYERGLAAAERKGDRHAAGELAGALAAM